jgi:NAD-dependent DNA ligase
LLKIIGASEDDFAKVPGFGKKMAQRTFSNIQEGLKDLPIPLLLGASGVFGSGMGTKKITTLLNDFPELLETFKTMKKENIYERILKVEGFSHKTSKKIVDNLEEAQKFILDIKKFATFKKEIVKIADDNLLNMKIVLSGFRDKKLEESIISRGGKVVTSVSKQTSILVVASLSSELSGKASKALELGVTILELKDFMDQFINV